MSDRERWADKYLHYQFSDPALLEQALTHRSASRHNNERLEFLGDAFLNFVVGKHLYACRPDYPEGDLSRARASLVRGSTLAEIAGSLALDTQVILGRGELRTGAAQRSAILADAVEALIAAVLIDGGHEAAEQLIMELLAERFLQLPEPADLKDSKTKLQEWLQARGLQVPVYSVESVHGRDHERVYAVRCAIVAQGEDETGRCTNGEGRSRRKAEQRAAEMMLAELQRDDGK